MAKLYILILNTPRQSLQTTLGDQDVKLVLFYQQSDKYWYLTVDSPPGTDSVKPQSARLIQFG